MILIRPVLTEKALKLIEAENKLVFEVQRKATKPEIAKALTELFKVKVEKVNTLIKKNRKYAFIKLKPETPAVDLAAKLGLI